MNKIKSLENRISNKGTYKLKWVVGTSPHHVLRDVCKKCFEKCYLYKKSTLNYLIKSIKARIVKFPFQLLF